MKTDTHPSRTAFRRTVGRILCAATILPLFWAAGFVWFLRDQARTRPFPPDSDGIVVLTGGALRVETGLALLDAGVAPRLLVSGVGDGVTVPSLLDAAWRPGEAGATVRLVSAELHRGHVIELGHGAQTTVGNAAETASWARADDLRSIVVVTAGYHMRRALAEIADALPEARLRPYPVHPQASLRLLALEYSKLLAVELDLVRSPHLRETS